MIFGAIDIGSNAVRLLIEDVTDRNGIPRAQKVAFFRVPLRLGADVFETGSISEAKLSALTKTMRAFYLLMEVHGVAHFQVHATSAMREAQNAEEIIERVQKKSGVRIVVIDGEHEANLIFKGFETVVGINRDRDFLYIDVGGGSTEITWIRSGIRQHSASFPLGTVRSLKGTVDMGVWEDVAQFIAGARDGERELLAIGTGGNINRLHRMSGADRFEPVSIEQLTALHERISTLSYEDRMETLGLKPDRADVIVPAGEIYIRIMRLAGASAILVPKVGLADGMILELYRQQLQAPSGAAPRRSSSGASPGASEGPGAGSGEGRRGKKA
jgi:exopolyphosphatase/guanosine-5'-triphosphate,3'-diphosphate pyrophosphatase